MDTPMCDKWAANLEERRIIEEFWEWLVENKAHNPELWRHGVPIVEIHIDKAMDEYHGIDQRELDKERRAILEEQRKLNDS